MKKMNFQRIVKFCILHFAFCILTLIPFLSLAGVKDTKHNLSVSAPADAKIRAVEETQICIFCHTPHNANPAQPLWNHELSAVERYKSYWSDTLRSYTQTESEAWPIDGFSKLCLSCHDGTVAIGAVISRRDEILMQGSCVDASGKLIGGEGCTGYLTDLSGTHPISIIFDEILKGTRDKETELMPLNSPLGINDSDVKLYPTRNGYGVQCTSCHDPHTNKTTETKDGKPWPPFWQKMTHDGVCLVCHEGITLEPPRPW